MSIPPRHPEAGGRRSAYPSRAQRGGGGDLGRNPNRRRTALDESEARFWALLGSSPDIVTVLHPDGTIRFNSPALTPTLGYRPEELEGRSVSEFVHPEDAKAVADAMAAAIASPGSPHSVEMRFRHRDGSWREFEVWGRYLPEVPGLGGLIVHSRDVTERRRNQALSARLGRIVEDSVNEIYVFGSQDFRFVQVNRGACENLGYSMDELRHMGPLDLKPALSADEFDRLLEPLLDGARETTSFNTQHRRKDGSFYDVEVRLSLARSESPPVFVAIIQDVTERNRTENQLRHAQKMEAIGRLAGGVAHDFNNLLTAIQGNAELLLDQPKIEPEHAALVGEIATAASRAADLTRELLAFSRKGPVQRVDVDVHEIVSEVASLLSRSIDKRISVECDLQAHASHVVGDPSLLHSALLNLGVNARDAMPDGGILAFRSCDAQALDGSPFIELAVSDTGVGMHEETKRRIFEPFFTTKPTGVGTGLGLAAAYGCVQSHSGEVSVESELGRGTTIRVRLPLPGQAVGRDAARAPEDWPQGSGHVVVVDDEAPVRRLALRALERLGYRASGCADAESALELLGHTADPVDLVLLDLDMPRMSGAEVLPRLRSAHPDVPVVVCSGLVPGDEVRALRRQGADGVMTKPYRIAQLAHTVQRHIARRARDGAAGPSSPRT